MFAVSFVLGTVRTIMIIIADCSGPLFLGSSSDFQRRLIRYHRTLGVLFSARSACVQCASFFFIFRYLSLALRHSSGTLAPVWPCDFDRGPKNQFSSLYNFFARADIHNIIFTYRIGTLYRCTNSVPMNKFQDLHER